MTNPTNPETMLPDVKSVKQLIDATLKPAVDIANAGAEAKVLVPEMKQALAETEQATTRANGAADVIGAAGLLYAGTDAGGIATLVTVEPRVTVTNETTAWAVIDGSMTLTGPVLLIGGTA